MRLIVQSTLLAFAFVGVLNACTLSSAADQPPSLVEVAGDQEYVVNMSIEALNIRSNRGPIESCQTMPDLPNGLTIESSSNSGQTRCVISGTPTQTQNLAEYMVTATNSNGSSTTMIRIIIELSATPSCESNDIPFSGVSAVYDIEFESTWSTANNGGNIPPNAGFTAGFGITHNANYMLWQRDQLAGEAVEALAEEDSAQMLQTEIATPESMRNINTRFTLPALATTSGMVQTNFNVHCDHPLVSFIASLTTGADWFTGISAVSLLDEEGDWHDSAEADLFVYDAGTEANSGFLRTGADMAPPALIGLVVGDAVIGLTTSRAKIGTVTFDRR